MPCKKMPNAVLLDVDILWHVLQVCQIETWFRVVGGSVACALVSSDMLMPNSFAREVCNGAAYFCACSIVFGISGAFIVELVVSVPDSFSHCKLPRLPCSV